MSHAWILYNENGQIHREGLPGLTVCGLGFTHFLGAVSVGTPYTSAPVCGRCAEGVELLPPPEKKP